MVDTAFNQANLGLNGGGVATGYESSSSYSSSNNGYGATGFGGDAAYGATGYGATGYGATDYGATGFGGDAAYGATGLTGAAGYGAAGLAGDAGYNVSSSNYSSSSAVQTYATDAQGLFQDSNPQVIRRPAPGGNVTYTQNIRVRFLQPPPVPPPGVSRSFFL
jgi:hypothetical protein